MEDEEYSVEKERHEAKVQNAFDSFLNNLIEDCTSGDILDVPIVELLAMAHSIGFQDGMEYAHEDIMEDIESIEESDENSKS